MFHLRLKCQLLSTKTAHKHNIIHGFINFTCDVSQVKFIANTKFIKTDVSFSRHSLILQSENTLIHMK